jgi:hypothetical protein
MDAPHAYKKCLGLPESDARYQPGHWKATLHGKLVGEKVKLVVADRTVFHVAIDIAELTQRLPKLGLVWPRMVKTLGLQLTLAGCLALWEGARRSCEVLPLLVELLVDLGAERKRFESLSGFAVGILRAWHSHDAVLGGGLRQRSRSTYAQSL